MINLALMKHPSNWLTIILMVIIAGFAFHQVAKFIEMKKKG